LYLNSKCKSLKRSPSSKISSTALFIDTAMYLKQELKIVAAVVFQILSGKHKTVLKRYEHITCFSRLNYKESIIPCQHQEKFIHD
jgi:hypothetical protein